MEITLHLSLFLFSFQPPTEKEWDIQRLGEVTTKFSVQHASQLLAGSAGLACLADACTSLAMSAPARLTLCGVQ